MTLAQQLARIERRLANIESALKELALGKTRGAGMKAVRALNAIIAAHHAIGRTDKEIAAALEKMTGERFSPESVRKRRSR